MLTINEQATTVFLGDSVADVAAWLQATPRQWGCEVSHDEHRGYTWDMGASWDQALKLAEAGWTEGAAKVDRGLHAMPAPNAKTSKLKYDVSGYYPDAGRYATGAPDCMVRRGNPLAHRPVVHIVINTRISASVSATEAMNFGIAMAGAIDVLESSGRRVELTVVQLCKLERSNHVTVCGWKIKRADEHLDLSAVAFALAHSAAFRRLGFAMMERAPKRVETPNYGYSQAFTPAIARLIDAEEALLIMGVDHNPRACATPSSALRFAANQINTAAGETLVELED